MDAELSVTLAQFSLPLVEPLETAEGSIETRAGYLLALDDGDHRGAGEATPLAGWTESLAACKTALETAAEQLRNGDTDAAMHAVEETPAARHAVTLARADLQARQSERPLYQFLGGDSCTTVPVNATIGDSPRPSTASSAREAVDAGFRSVKVKVGRRDPIDDAGRIRAVRDAVGPDIEVRADANAAWDRESARRAIKAFERSTVSYVEQPVAPDDIEGLAALRGSSVGIAVDETLSVVTLDTLLRAGAADVVVVKPMVLGGIDRARHIAVRAREAGVTPVVTTTVDAVVARTGAVHLAASLDQIPPCGLATAARLEHDLATDPAPIRNGVVHVPQTPGIGVDLSGRT